MITSEMANHLSSYHSIQDIREILFAQINDNNTIFSFDIFDTIIIRKIDPPYLIKQLSAKKTSEILKNHDINATPNDILNHRKIIEYELQSEAFKNGNDRECNLDNVIKELVNRLDSSNNINFNTIIDFEIELEKSATCVMPGILDVLRTIKRADKRIIGITETYLSKIQINTLLEYRGLKDYFDELYVSSDIGLSKNTGNLYRYVIKKESLNITHVGDNYKLDHIIPARLGIKTLWLHDKAELKRKSKLRKLVNNKNKMEYINAIVMRDNEKPDPLYKIGYHVLGPALTVFIHNIMEQSKNDNNQRMFFIARDGYILKKIYDILRHNIYKDNLPLSRYMCMSRLSIKLASLKAFGVGEIDAYLKRDYLNYLALRNLLNSYGLEPNEFVEIARKYGIDLDDLIYSPAQDSRLNALLDNHEFQCKIMGNSIEAKNILREYLLNIGFMGSERVAFIDAQGTGISQMLLENTFLGDNDYPFVHGYYFDLANNGSNIDSPQINGIIFDWRSDSKNGERLFEIFGSLIELFSHPNHGVTAGYKRRCDGKVIPIFRKTPMEDQYIIRSKIIDGAISYARDYSISFDLHNYNCNNLIEDEKQKIKQWIAFPSKKDVSALKDVVAIDDWPIEISIPLVKQLKGVDLLRPKTFAQKVITSLWPEGTLRLSTIPTLNWLFYKITSSKIINFRFIKKWIASLSVIYQ